MPHPRAIHTMEMVEMIRGERKPFMSTVLYMKNSPENFRKAITKEPSVAKYRVGSSIRSAVQTHSMHVTSVHAEKVLPCNGLT